MADARTYKFKHIVEMAATRQWLVRAPRAGQLLLGRVVVNTGGQFRLYLYDSVEEDAQSVAYIINPAAGQTFTYDCALDHGIAYQLEGPRSHAGNPYSITITYMEV